MLSILCIGFRIYHVNYYKKGKIDFQFFVLDSESTPRCQIAARQLSILCIGFIRCTRIHRIVQQDSFNSLYWIRTPPSPSPRPLVTHLSILCIGFVKYYIKSTVEEFIAFNSLYWIRRSGLVGLRRGFMLFQFFVLDSGSPRAPR